MSETKAGTVAREGFESRELAVTGETAVSAAAAQASAQVQARYVMAVRRPRDMDQVRAVLLKECARPAFAEAAKYSLSFGRTKVEGPSIRFAEAAARCMTNLYPESAVLYEDDQKRVVRVTVTDLEANVTYARDIVVPKVVERRQLRDGQVPIKSRTNATGETVYTVEASESDLQAKMGAAESKALRTLVLRVIPGDIVDEALAACEKTLADKTAKDPDGERKKVSDAFASLNVLPAALRDYLGHDLGQCSPAELGDLRGVFAAIRDGETTWGAVMDSRRAEKAPESATARKTAEQLKAEERAKAAEKAKP